MFDVYCSHVAKVLEDLPLSPKNFLFGVSLKIILYFRWLFINSIAGRQVYTNVTFQCSGFSSLFAF